MFFPKKIIIQTKFILPILIIIAFFFILIKDKPLMADENQYYPIIEKVTNLDFDKNILSKTSALPGYSFVIGFLRFSFNITDVAGTRLITTIFSLLSIIIFYLIAKEFDIKNAKIKTLQFLFLPILFIYLFLIYTDVFSLFLILLSFYFLVKENYFLSGSIAFLSLPVRQNNIIWIIFFCIYIFLDKKKYNRNIFPYLPSFFAIIIFVFLNRGGTIGIVNQWAQPFAIHLQNVYFALFLFFFLFLPLNLLNSSKIIHLLKTNYKIFILLAIFSLVYFFTFRIDHPWNQILLDYFLRNKILDFSNKSFFNKTVFFLPIIYSFLSLLVIKMKEKNFYSVYFFIFLSLSSLWLIEPRYYFPAFAFFILFKKEQSKTVEYLTIFIFIIASVYIFLQTINNVFFL